MLYLDGRIKWTSFSITRLLALGFVVTAVFSISFGPFIYMVGIIIVGNCMYSVCSCVGHGIYTLCSYYQTFWKDQIFA